MKIPILNPVTSVTTVTFTVSAHAQERMRARRITMNAVTQALRFGRAVYARGAEIFAIGRREIELWGREGIDLAPLEGIQAIVASGVVLTVYRNRNLRDLRADGGRRRRHR